jgi:hypothetical protein
MQATQKEHDAIVSPQSQCLWISQLCRGAGCHFAKHQKDEQTVVRAKGSATCTFVQCHFIHNTCKTGNPTKRAAGPVAGFDKDAAGWFHDCTYKNNTSTQADKVPVISQHEIMIKASAVRVLTDTVGYPLVYDNETGVVKNAILVFPVGAGAADDDVLGGRNFPTEADEPFVEMARVCSEPLSASSFVSWLAYMRTSSSGGSSLYFGLLKYVEMQLLHDASVLVCVWGFSKFTFNCQGVFLHLGLCSASVRVVTLNQRSCCRSNIVEKCKAYTCIFFSNPTLLRR